MLCKVAIESGGHIARCGVLAEVGCGHIPFKVSAEVCSSGVFTGSFVVFATDIDGFALLELDFRTVIYTGDASECEHQREVLGPLCGSAVESGAVIGAGAVVVRIHVDHIE